LERRAGRTIVGLGTFAATGRAMSTSRAGDDLVASYFTLTGSPVLAPPRFSFEERVAAAAEAGFAGIGLLSDDYVALRGAGRTDADLRAVLDDHGVGITEIEFLFDWAYDDERAEQARETEATLFAMADAFSPHHLNVGDINPPGSLPGLDVVAERFATLCDRAAEHGVAVTLEFLPWTGLPDLATGWDVVRAAGRPNGGLVVDVWHYFRGGPDDELLRSIPASHVLCVQLDDADAPVGPPEEDTMTRRRLPGEGSLDVVGLVRILDEIGVDIPYSVEILSTEHQALPVREQARRAYDSTRSVLAAARR